MRAWWSWCGIHHLGKLFFKESIPSAALADTECTIKIKVCFKKKKKKTQWTSPSGSVLTYSKQNARAPSTIPCPPFINTSSNSEFLKDIKVLANLWSWISIKTLYHSRWSSDWSEKLTEMCKQSTKTWKCNRFQNYVCADAMKCLPIWKGPPPSIATTTAYLWHVVPAERNMDKGGAEVVY